MFTISEKSKFELKKAGILSSLFLALFFVGFYAINLLDIKSITNKNQQVELSEETRQKEELAKKVAADGIDMADFQAWAKTNNLSGKDIYDGDPDNDGLPNSLEYTYGTDPSKADTDDDGFSDKQEILNGYDPVAPGETKPEVFVKIEKIGVDAPMVWSQSDDDQKMLKDLENGLSHFAKTAAPGQNGNAIISGHSSNYAWAKGSYNYVFKDLEKLEKNDVVNIKIVQKNGKTFFLKYVVSDKFITTPDDERIFADTENPTLTLSTCWPVGTALKRTIIKAELIN